MENNVQSTETTKAKDTNHQYEQYKPALKKECIFKVMASLCAIIGVILMLFVPFFVITMDFEGGSMELYKFSLFDKIKDSFNSISYISIYQIIAAVFLCAGLVMACYSLIKNIVTVFNPESYALETYDKIKRGATEKKRWGTVQNEPSYYIISAVVFEVICIAFERLFTKTEYSISSSIVFCVIFFVVYLVLFVISKMIFKKVKLSVLKEDYGINK